MKQSEMTTIGKIMTIVELGLGILFIALVLLSSFEILENGLVCCGFLFVHCLCQAFIARHKVMRVIWANLAAIGCILFFFYCFVV